MSVWPQSTLGEHVELLSGFAFPSEKFNTEEGTPLIRIRDVVRGVTETKFRGEFDLNYLVRDGDTLIGMDGQFNVGTWTGGPALLNQRVCRIKTKPTLDSRFLFHFLPKALKQIEDATSFVTVKHLSVNDIRAIRFPLPPLPEQRRIAAILDQAEALRAKRRKALAKLDTLTQSLFLEMFHSASNQPVLLGEVAEVRTGGTPSRSVQANYGGDIPWVKTTEVNGRVITGTEEHLTVAGLTGSNCKVFPKHSLLIAMYGQGKTRGQSAMLGIEAATNQACAVIMPNERFSSSFMFAQLQLKYEELRALGRGGNQPNLNLELVRSLPVFVPELKNQLKFEAWYRKLSELRERYSIAHIRLDNLRSSLQHRAFRGEL